MRQETRSPCVGPRAASAVAAGWTADRCRRPGDARCGRGRPGGAFCRALRDARPARAAVVAVVAVVGAAAGRGRALAHRTARDSAAGDYAAVAADADLGLAGPDCVP